MRRLTLIVTSTVAVALLLGLLGIGLFQSRYLPVLSRLAVLQVSRESVRLIESTIGEKIQSGSIDYDRMILFEKNAEGLITALKTNMQEVNRLKSEILQLVYEKISNLNGGISAGTLLFPGFFSGRGPGISIRVQAIQSVNAVFLSEFTQAGINQTLHRLKLNVQVKGSVLVMGKSFPYSVSDSVLIAETVIVGNVPHTYS